MGDDFEIGFDEAVIEESKPVDVDAAIDSFNEDIADDIPEVMQPQETIEEPKEIDPAVLLVEDLAKQNGMDTNEYIQAVYEQRIEQEVADLMQRGLTEEMAYEVLETRMLKAQHQAETQARQQEDEMLEQFLSDFKKSNGRDWTPNDEIPQKAWEDVKNGVSLKDAYSKHYKDPFLQGFDSI